MQPQQHLGLDYRICRHYLITACGVRLDSQTKLAKTPFQVDLNCMSRSDPALKPAEPTNTKCFTCSGYYTNGKRGNHLDYKSSKIGICLFWMDEAKLSQIRLWRQRYGMKSIWKDQDPEKPAFQLLIHRHEERTRLTWTLLYSELQ